MPENLRRPVIDSVDSSLPQPVILSAPESNCLQWELGGGGWGGGTKKKMNHCAEVPPELIYYFAMVHSSGQLCFVYFIFLTKGKLNQL